MTDFHIGVDLGGTHLRAALVHTGDGQILTSRKEPTHAHEGYQAVMNRMVTLIQAVLQDAGLPAERVGGIGVGVPGTPDLLTGDVKFLPNLPGNWRDVPLARYLNQQLNLPVYLLNDVRCVALAEWRFGAGRGVDNMVCYAIGTGIGGGVVLNGKLHLGLDGTAGELGHQVVELNGVPCGCGGRGCLEMYASGPAITAMGVKFVLHGHTTRIGELVNYNIEKITAATVVNAAKEGDPTAQFILQQAGSYLGIAVSSVIVAISPQKIVFGGGVAEAGEFLLEPVRKTIIERVHMVPLDKVKFVRAELGNLAGLVGAAYWPVVCSQD
jgi:glucokinase